MGHFPKIATNLAKFFFFFLDKRSLKTSKCDPTLKPFTEISSADSWIHSIDLGDDIVNTFT